MKSLNNLVLMGLILVVLSGCGTTKTAVRPDAAKNISTIAVIQVYEPQAYVAQDFGNVGTMFGAAGGAVAGASSASAGKSVSSVTANANYKAGEKFTSELNNKLSAVGYKVSVITVSKEDKNKLLESYDSVDANGADAILDVAIESMGYATEHPMFSPHWRPASQVRVALVDTRTNEKLYEEKFMYGYHNPFLSGTDIEAPEQYQFDTDEELFADDEKLINGLNDSIDAVVDHVIGALKK